MGLRLKMILILVAVVVPVSLVFSVYRFAVAKRDFVERRADRVAARLDVRPLEHCKREPARWSVERRGFHAFAFGPDLESANPRAPEFPAELVDALPSELGEPEHIRFWVGRPHLGATAVRVAEDGPCAIMLVLWDADRRGPPVFGIVLRQTVLLAMLLTVVGLLISEPLVRRVRRLTDAVDAADGDRFENPEAERNDELAELAGTFAATLDALHERDKTLKEYIANTTHDLAIPLTVLQHRLQRLSRELGADDERLEHVRTALEESHYIAGLIANMSAAAKLESEQVAVEAGEVNLAEVVERVVGRHRPIAEQRSVDLNWAVPEEDVVVQADSTLVEQVVSNLVQNAVQYNSAGGHVSVVLEAEGDDFTVEVVDDGPGIPEALLENVATRGIRSDDARSRNDGGQGFGLAIAHGVCERHGWTLELENREPTGLVARVVGRRGTRGGNAPTSKSGS